MLGRNARTDRDFGTPAAELLNGRAERLRDIVGKIQAAGITSASAGRPVR